MTIQQPEYILEVNRSGSMSKAAKNLFVSHSSVRNSVAALEEDLAPVRIDRICNKAPAAMQGGPCLRYSFVAAESFFAVCMSRSNALCWLFIHREMLSSPCRTRSSSLAA